MWTLWATTTTSYEKGNSLFSHSSSANQPKRPWQNNNSYHASIQVLGDWKLFCERLHDRQGENNETNFIEMICHC